VPLATSLSAYPLAVAIAFSTIVDATETGPPYTRDDAVGVLPSVV
jgi:hypothetical protein